jgi:hypothetical protein
LHRDSHRIEDCIDSHLGFNLGDVGHLDTSLTMSTSITA